jgi:AMP phosphorylase
MSFNLIAKQLDIASGGEQIVLVNEATATKHGIHPGDHIILSKKGVDEIICVVDTTTDVIGKRHIGIFKDIYEKYGIKNDADILITLFEKPISVEYIKKKIKGQQLSYGEIKTIIEDIVVDRLGVIEKTYFLSTIYNPGYSEEELYSLAKAMAETGSELSFDGIVGDKHSIGGIAGKGITPIVVAIVASFGVKVPNTSTRSITSPAGTTDMLETIVPMTFTVEQVKEFIEKENACMVWGGGLNIAPADEDLIRIETPMEIESYDKILVSILAKKIAVGDKFLVIDVPAGSEGKIHHQEDIISIKEHFTELGAKFGMKVVVSDRYPNSIDGNAAGPKLEMREVLYIFENHPAKSIQLENEAIRLAGILLELCGVAQTGEGEQKAREAMQNGSAFEKFKRIIAMQGGNRDVYSSELDSKAPSLTFRSVRDGAIKSIQNKKVLALGSLLGCPLDTSAGIYFYKKPGETISKGMNMFTIYATAPERLQLGAEYIKSNNLFEIV